MNRFADKPDVATGGSSGIAFPASQKFMNSLVKMLMKLGILTEDLDYHLIRTSMVIIFLFFGYQKWFQYEAEVLIPLPSAG